MILRSQALLESSLVGREELMECGIMVYAIVGSRPYHNLRALRSPSVALGVRGPKGHTSAQVGHTPCSHGN